MNYIVLSIIVLFFSKIYQQLNKNGKTKIFALLFICFILCFFAGSRSTYNDTYAYREGFIKFNLSFSEIFNGEFSISAVYGFSVWQWLIRQFTGNYHIFFFLSSALFVIPSVILIDKYSQNFTFSMLLFLTCGIYMFSLAALKQMAATGIMIIGILSYLKHPDKGIKRYLIYYFFCALAISFHGYAVIYLLVPLFGKKLFNKRTIAFLVIMAAFAVFSSAFYSIVIGVSNFIGNDITEETLNRGSVNVFRALVFAVPFILTLIGNRKIAEFEPDKQFIIKLSMFSSLFMIMALFGNPILFGRLPYYFVVATAVALPTIIRNVFDIRSRKIINLIATLGYISFAIYGLHQDGAFARDIFNMQLWW